MKVKAENTDQDIFDVEEITSEGSNLEVEENSDAALNRESSEIALKLVNAVKSMNNGEITHYELVNSFNSSNELKCLFLLIRALPYNPIAKIYPETPFLFFNAISELSLLRAASAFSSTSEFKPSEVEFSTSNMSWLVFSACAFMRLIH